MAERALLDTGFLVALVNRLDPDHQACAEAWAPLRAELFTVEGVLVEAAWLLRKVRGGPRAAVDLVVDAGAVVVPSSPARLLQAAALMERYASVPMDLVDALLVCAADEHRVSLALTLDKRGFRAYRLRNRRALRLLPA